MMNRITLALLVLALGLALAPEPLGAATIYRWVDENGTVHFGERPPEGVEARPMAGSISMVPVPKSAQPAPAADGTETAEGESLHSIAAQRREERATARATAEADQAQRQVKCQSMQQQLSWAEPNPRVIVQDADGTTRRLDDDERMKLVNEAKDFLANNDCD